MKEEKIDQILKMVKNELLFDDNLSPEDMVEVGSKVGMSLIFSSLMTWIHCRTEQEAEKLIDEFCQALSEDFKRTRKEIRKNINEETLKWFQKGFQKGEA